MESNLNDPTDITGTENAAAGGAVASDAVTFRRSHLYAVLLPLAFVLGLSVGYLFWGRSAPAAAPAGASNAAAAQAAGTASAGEDRQVRRYDIPADDDPFLGPADATITIIEFSDYECPFCTKWHDEVWPQIQAAYPNQVRLVYRDFPLSSIHANAIPAAEAANCAGEQDKYWEYHGALFGNAYGLGRSSFERYATDLKMDLTAFNECLDSRRYQEEVEADYNFAAELGIRSTPTFFINGIALVGAQPFDVFKEVIDLELAGELE
jgi:protein-disulfide isomerase